MIEKTPIVSQDRKLTNARRSDHRCTLATRASAARAASSLGHERWLGRVAAFGKEIRPRNVAFGSLQTLRVDTLNVLIGPILDGSDAMSRV
ncbi:hypothetical protein MAXJ12_34514 [Mesorhizobium alhagi CCNWXJ12-2]|uniref:Uncharacterized protein n=1 Tax=Mesorhizobium alhagi CCNWXJ12-2 TaxID=1107882 RepID=H0I341_9HYPH|nr:hypothetical protein MAXJ12_34514 [Mesorhizobium alhagi CCNWXJ12-2]